MGVAQDPPDRADDRIQLGYVGNRQLDLDIRPPPIAVDASHRREGHEYLIVLALAEEGPLFLEQPDYFHPLVVDLNVLANGIPGQGQVIPDLDADDRDIAASLVIADRQEAAVGDESLTDLLIAVRRADNLGLGRQGLIVDSALCAHDWRNRFDAVDTQANELVILLGQTRVATLQRRLERRERPNRDAVAAEPLKPLVDQRAQSLDDRHHRDHRGDADDDAERRQKAAEAVGANRAECGPRALGEREPERSAHVLANACGFSGHRLFSHSASPTRSGRP